MTKPFSSLCLSAALTLAVVTAGAQAIVVPNHGTATAQACGGTVYDNGGADNNYSDGCDGVLVIAPDAPNKGVTLAGSYNIEQGFDHLFIYQGDEPLDENLLATCTGEGELQAVTSLLGAMTLRFTSDGSENRPGFALEVTCADVNLQCLPPRLPEALSASDTHATLSWTPTTAASLYNIEYGPAGYAPGSGAVAAGVGLPFVLEGLAPATVYSFRVQADCGAEGVSAWSSPAVFTTLAACPQGLEAQAFTIGNGLELTNYIPLNTDYANSYTQQIFTGDELAALGVFQGEINALAFQYMNGSAQTRPNVSIYLGHTDKQQFDGPADYIDPATLELVYNGPISLDNSHLDMWNETLLQTPFAYDGQSGLALAVLSTGGDNVTGWRPTFYAHSTDVARALTLTRDQPAYDPSGELPDGTLGTLRSNVRFVACVSTPDRVSVSGRVTGALDGEPVAGATVAFRGSLGGATTTDAQGGYAIELVQGFSYSVEVDAPGYNAYLQSFTTPDASAATHDIGLARPRIEIEPGQGIAITAEHGQPAQAQIAVSNTGDGPLTWKATVAYVDPEGRGGATRSFTYDFEDGLQGWTPLDANPDGGTWVHSDNNPSGNDYASLQLAHSGTGFALGYSFANGVGALATDSYLVSPQMYGIAPGDRLRFWADNAIDDNPETLEVCYATAAAPTPADFTALWAGNAKKGGRYENWREHTVELGDLAGLNVWLALRDATEGGSEIWIDDVEVEASAAIDWWLAASDRGGVVPAGGQQVVTLTFDTGHAPEGTFQAQIDFRTHTPDVGGHTLPVALTIVPEGTPLAAGDNAAPAPAPQAWPNPAGDILNVSCGAPRADIEIRDMLGRPALRARTDGTHMTLDVSALAPGAYLLVATAPDGARATARFVKR